MVPRTAMQHSDNQIKGDAALLVRKCSANVLPKVRRTTADAGMPLQSHALTHSLATGPVFLIPRSAVHSRRMIAV